MPGAIMITAGGGNAPMLQTYKATNVSLATSGDKYIFTGLPSSPFRVTSLVAWNFSGTPGALVAYSLRDAAAGLGNQLISSGVGLNLIVVTPLTDAIPLDIGTLFRNKVYTNSTLYFNVAVGNVSALTCNLNLTISLL